MGENIATIGDFLGFCFPGRDIDAEMKRFEAGIDQLQPAFNRVVARACEAVGRLEDMPPSPGYEPLLVKAWSTPGRGAFLFLCVEGSRQENGRRSQNATDRRRGDPLPRAAWTYETRDFPEGRGTARVQSGEDF